MTSQKELEIRENDYQTGLVAETEIFCKLRLKFVVCVSLQSSTILLVYILVEVVYEYCQVSTLLTKYQ